MKQSIFVLGAAALMLFAACEKEISLEIKSKGLSFNATVEQQVDPSATKTVLSGTSVSWVAGDAVKVFDEAGKTGMLTADTQGSSVHFTQVGDLEDGFDESGAIYVIYPYSAATSASGSTITFTLPATQNYVKDSFDPACNVAVGSLSARTVAFKNAFGLLKLQLTGNVKVSRIELVGNNNEKLNGTFTVDASVESAAVASGAPTAAEKKVTLSCSTYTNEGVNLDPDTATAFYFVVPADSFGSGFTATIYDWSGDSYNVELSTVNSNIVSRSHVRAMPAAPANLGVPSGYTLKKWVKSTIEYEEGEDVPMACINTKVAGGNDNLAIDCVFEYNHFVPWKGIYGNYATDLAASESGNPENYNVTRLLLDDKSAAPSIGGYMNSKADESSSGSRSWLGGGVIDDTRFCTLNTKAKLAINGAYRNKAASGGVVAGTTNNTSIALFANRVLDNTKHHPTVAIEGTFTSTTTIYTVRIKDNGTSVRLFIPCARNADGEAGFYDLVGGEFYPNMSGYGALSVND